MAPTETWSAWEGQSVWSWRPWRANADRDSRYLAAQPSARVPRFSFLLGLNSDQRGFPRLNSTYAGYTSSGPCLDAGAVQTNYTSVEFVQQPGNSVAGMPITPSPTVAVLETNTNLSPPNDTDAVNGIPVTLTLSGTGSLEGTLSQNTSGGVATFGNLISTQAGTGDTLAVSLPLLPGTTLKATSIPFNVTTACGQTQRPIL